MGIVPIYQNPPGRPIYMADVHGSKRSAYIQIVTDPTSTGHTSNLWGKCPLYDSNAMGRLISQEIHYWPLDRLEL